MVPPGLPRIRFALVQAVIPTIAKSLLSAFHASRLLRAMPSGVYGFLKTNNGVKNDSASRYRIDIVSSDFVTVAGKGLPGRKIAVRMPRMDFYQYFIYVQYQKQLDDISSTLYNYLTN